MVLFELFAVTEIQVADNSKDFFAGFGNHLNTRFKIIAHRTDTQRDGCGADGNSHAGLAITRDHVAQSLFHVAFAGPKEFHHAACDRLCTAGHFQYSIGNRLGKHPLHLRRHTRQREDAAIRLPVPRYG